MLLNYKSGSFEFKFKRKAKRRTIKELHSLYKRSLERSNIFRSELSELIKEIVEKTPEFIRHQERSHQVYFNEDDKTYKYTFTYRKEFNSWAWSFDILQFKGDVTTIRDSKIDFIFSNEVEFELGNRFRKLDKSFVGFERKVKHVLIEEIIEHLVSKFKKVKFTDVPRVIPIKVNDEIMTFKLTDRSYGDYKNFEYIGDLSEVIEL
jgi:hypothetical protein